MKWRRYWWLLALLLLLVPLAVAVVAASLPRGDERFLTTPDSWKHIGSIQAIPVDPKLVYGFEPDPVYLIASALTVDGQGDGSGLLESRPFRAPGWISLSVTGDLTRAGNEVFLRRVEQHDRIPILANTERHLWRRVTVALPGDWEGQPIQLVVKAGPRTPESLNWFGISNPRALASGTVLLSHLRSLAALPAFAVALVLFLLPGMAPALRLADRGWTAPSMTVPVAIVFGCLAGYLTFWAYFLHHHFGLAFGGAVLVGSLVLSFTDLRRNPRYRALLLSAEVAIPLALMALVGLFYVALWLSINLWTPFHDTTRQRFLEFILTQDNKIPIRFAENLYAGHPPRGELMGEWHYSDRPPLQAGLLLLQLPVAHASGHYREFLLVASIALQCAWVPALWALWRTSGLSRRQAGLALLFITFTGFALVNTVFTWPKILSGALAVVAVTVSLFDRGLRGRRLQGVLLGLAAALATTGHGGVALSLAPLGLLILLPRYFPGFSRLVIAAAVYLAVTVPWGFFQSLYDPPGNLLIRQHLADRKRPWEEDQSTLRNIIDSYRPLDAREILVNKLANLRVLFRASEKPADDQYPWPPNGHPDPWPVNASAFRRCEFMCLFWAPGLMNLGWLVGLAALWRRMPSAWRPGWPVAGVALGGALAWVLAMFAPGSTVIHQGSYATLLLLFAALAGWLATLPGTLARILLAVHATVFTVAWLLTSPGNHYGIPNWFMILFAVAFLGLLVKFAVGIPEALAPVEAEAGTTRARPGDQRVQESPRR
jgi:hypothetical protein